MMDEVVDILMIQLELSWKQYVGDYLLQLQMCELFSFLCQCKVSGVVVFLFGLQIFVVFDVMLFEQVKVVIFGQDLYYGRGQVYGLSFLVLVGVLVLLLLLNIYKEIESDFGILCLDYGCLILWV